MNLTKPMVKKTLSNKKEEQIEEKGDNNFSADKLLTNPTIKKLFIQKLMSVPEVRKLIIKTVIEKTLS